MKGLFSAVATAALLQAASAHYIFSNLIVDGNYTGTYEYVRKNTNNNSPLTDPTSTDFRCNTGAQDSAASTKTYTVAAGSTVGMGVGFGGSVIHPGPLLVYLSKAPEGTTAAAYDGSGDWFKIHELGTSVINSTGMFWETTNQANFTWTLPADTPPGDYLMRTEHIALHQAESVGGAQFYMECAQLSVTGGSASASPSPTAKIPGMYTGTEAGIEINIYYPIPQSYDFPGPALWPAGADSANSTGSAVVTSAGSAAAPAATKVASSVLSSFSHFPNATATNATVKATSAAGAGGPVAVSSAAAGSFPGSSGSSGSGSSGSSVVITSAAAVPAASSVGSNGAAGAQTLYGQCGGENWAGATACAVGSCVSQNPYYHQCLSTAGANKAATSVAAVAAASSAPAAAAVVTSAASPTAAAAVPTTLVKSKKKCTGKAKSTGPAGTGGIKPTGGVFPSGGRFATGSGSGPYARPTGGLRPSGFRPEGTGSGPMITA